MAYELPFDKFIGKVNNPEMKKVLRKAKLPDEAFFGEKIWKRGDRVRVNIDAKCSAENMRYLSKFLKVERSGKNLDFAMNGDTIRFIESSKKAVGKSRNAMGKALADAGELATVESLKKEIKTPEDTGQRVFIDDVDAFIAWLPTFQHTRKAVESVVGSLGSFDVLHDATDKSDFKKVIDAFTKKIKMAKDSWNPADIFIIKTSKKSEIISSLKEIVENYELKDGLVSMFNNELYSYYKKGLLYPISLKQLNSDKATVDYNNEPGKMKVAMYDIEIDRFNISLGGSGKELGVFTFKNKDTGKKIAMQVRGFPHGYGTAQTEITSDGTKTGGRLGKVSAQIVDRVIEEFGSERIKSISYFGKAPNTFSTFDERRKKEVYSWYKEVSRHSKVNDQNPLSYSDFHNLVEEAKEDYDIAASLVQKIQGLKIAHFYISNEGDISVIMNKKINGAKKVSADNGFFIKIY